MWPHHRAPQRTVQTVLHVNMYYKQKAQVSLVINTALSSELWLSDVLPSHIGSLSQNSVSELVQHGWSSLVNHFTWCYSGTASMSSPSARHSDNECIKLFFSSIIDDDEKKKIHRLTACLYVLWTEGWFDFTSAHGRNGVPTSVLALAARSEWMVIYFRSF